MVISFPFCLIEYDRPFWGGISINRGLGRVDVKITSGGLRLSLGISKPLASITLESDSLDFFLTCCWLHEHMQEHMIDNRKNRNIFFE